jgi:transcriptional regulator with PAS, ATPase and Fis domain
MERELIERALERSGGNVSRAARELGISRDTLRYRLARREGEED